MRLLSLLGVCGLIVCVVQVFAHDCCHKKMSPDMKSGGVCDYVKKAYEGVSGYSIPSNEREDIVGHGGEPTYGEITPEGVSQLIAEFELTKDSVFYDLGSGVGKVAVQIYLESPVKKSFGIELSKTRHDCGAGIMNKLKEEKKIVRNRTLKLVCADILAKKYLDATHIYTASLCFSDEFMEKLTAHLAQHGKPGLIVASLRPLTDGHGFVLIKTKTHPMTWSEDTPVYFYRLEGKK